MQHLDTRRIWRIDNPNGKIPATASERYEHQLKWRDTPWLEEQKPESRLPKAWGGWTWAPSGIVRSTPPSTFFEIVDELVTARDYLPARAALQSTTALTTAFDARTAVHEASHAICDDETGRRLAEVLVREDGSGECVPDRTFKAPEMPMRESVVNSMAVLAAGRIGERLKYGDAPSDAEITWRIGTRPVHDEEGLQALPRLFTSEDPATLRAEAETKAELILRKRWADVEKVAAALEQRGRLSMEEFYAVIGKAPPTSDRWRERLDEKYGAAAVDRWLVEQGYTNLVTTQVRRVQLPLQTRSASVTSSGDSIKVCWGGGGRVLRNGWDGKFWEDLPAENADLSWLNSGRASFLDSHNQSSTSDIYGVVVAGSAFVRGGKGYCEIRLGANAPVGLKDGTLNNISIGYKINKIRQMPAGNDDIPVMLIEAFEIIEVSCVGTPADRDAQVLRVFEATVVTS